MDKFEIKDSEMTEIFRVNSKYFDLTDKEKLKGLLLMDDWVKTEIKKLKNTSANSDYARCGCGEKATVLLCNKCFQKGIVETQDYPDFA